MPFTGATLTGAAIDATNTTVTCEGTNFGENQYAVSDIQVSKDNGANWIAVDTIDSWGNLECVGSFSAPLTSGTYDVKVITSDNETIELNDAFFIVSKDDGSPSMAMLSIGAELIV